MDKGNNLKEKRISKRRQGHRIKENRTVGFFVFVFCFLFFASNLKHMEVPRLGV